MKANMFSARDYLISDDKIINVIGDSHSCFFYGADRCVIHQPINGVLPNPVSCIDQFRVYHVGAALAYNLCENNTTTKGRERILHLLDNVIEDGSRILLCFGEIDCRYQIFKAAQKHEIAVEEAMEECVSRYVAFAREIKAMGFDVMVWGVVASLPDSAESDKDYPRFGTCVERNILTRQFNARLGQLLAEQSIGFASIFEILVDVTNETKSELYIADKKHLAQTAMPAAIEVIEQAYSRNAITI